MMELQRGIYILYKVIFFIICAGLFDCVCGACYFADTLFNFMIVSAIAVELLCLLYGVINKIFLRHGRKIFLVIFLAVFFAILLPKCYYVLRS